MTTLASPRGALPYLTPGVTSLTSPRGDLPYLAPGVTTLTSPRGDLPYLTPGCDCAGAIADMEKAGVEVCLQKIHRKTFLNIYIFTRTQTHYVIFAHMQMSIT